LKRPAQPNFLMAGAIKEEMSPAPNDMYSNMIENNRDKLISEIIKQ